MSRLPDHSHPEPGLLSGVTRSVAAIQSEVAGLCERLEAQTRDQGRTAEILDRCVDKLNDHGERLTRIEVNAERDARDNRGREKRLAILESRWTQIAAVAGVVVWIVSNLAELRNALAIAAGMGAAP